MGTEVAGDGTVVYGTGYNYDPWIGSVWYGPPVTYGWGFNDCWTPWCGWGFGCGFGWDYGLGWGGCFPPRPWWCGFRNWRDHEGDDWWHGADHGAWANANADIYHHGSRAPGGGFARRDNVTGFGQAYNSRTGLLQAGQESRFHSVAGRNFAYNRGSVSLGYAGVQDHYGTRFGGLNPTCQPYPGGARYGGRSWPEIPSGAYNREVGAPWGGPAPKAIVEGPGHGGGVPGGPNTGFHGGGFHGGGGFGGGHGGGGGHR